MRREQQEQFINIKLLDFIRVNPSSILNIFFDQLQSRLFVSREHYSEIYEIVQNEKKTVSLQQIAELEPSMYFLNFGTTMCLFKPFQLKLFRNGRWEYHSFTSQLLSIRMVGQTVYSFHERETMVWHFEEEDFSFKFVAQSRMPYHIDSEGSIVGLGKRVKQVNKGAKLLKCEVIQNKWVFVGDDRGCLHVYDWKFLAHVKTFHQHQAPVLAIKVSPENNTVYFTGSDSKICMIRLVGDEWQLGEHIRGQSHDIFALQLYNGHLISGGITTDLCFYPLLNGQFSGQFIHKVSYRGANLVSTEGKYIMLNHRNSFQIWEMGVSIYRTKLMVRYTMPQDKFIIDLKVFKQPIEENTLLLLVVTDQETVGWKFSAEKGLVKYVTIQNVYEMVQMMPKHTFLGVRTDGLIERVNCLNGKIEQITNCEIQVPTDIQYIGNATVLVGSRVSQALNVINIRSKQILYQYNFHQPYTYLDHYDSNTVLIQYFNQPILKSLHLTEQKETERAQLPVSMLRFGGWLNSITKYQEKTVKSQIKKYWYGISEGKVVIIANIMKEGKKKIRVKQAERIAQIIKPTGKGLGCNLAVIPYNFTRMIEELPVKPVFTKKIV